MSTPKTKVKDPLKIRNYSIFGAIGWTLLLAFMLISNIKTLEKEALKRAYIYTQVGFEKDVLYRRWVSEHGGVYVKVDSTTPPSPYLSHIPDRDIIVDSALKFTLMNPAYMTRQVYELQEASGDMRGHITSLKPIRPENAPDEWETKALLSFEEGATEISGIDTLNGKAYFRFMEPFITEQSCLKCHAKDGYALNDIRGGISISYPMSRVAVLYKAEILNRYLIYFILWILGISGIVLSYFQLMKNDRKRILAEESLRELNVHLEEKIEQRSHELQKAQAEWENVFNTLEAPAQLIDKNHTIKYVNDATLKVFNKTKEELIHKKCHNLFHLSDTPPAGCPLVSASNENKTFNNEMRFEADGTTFIVSCSPIYGFDGNIKYFMHIMTDISERKEMELNLSNANAIINRSPAVAFRWKNEEGWPVEFVTENVEVLTGFSEDEFKRGLIQFRQIIHQEDIERVTKEVSDNSLVDKNQFTHQPYRIITKNEEVKWVNDITFIRRDSSGNITHFEGIVIDITKQQLVLKALQESEEQFRAAFQTSIDSVNITRIDDGRYINVNQGFLDVSGYTEKEVIGKTSIELNIWENPKDREKLVAAIKSKGYINNLEANFVKKDGSIFIGLMSANVVEINKKPHILSVTRDITDRKIIEEELRKYREELEDLVKERTKEVEEKNETLESMNKLFVGRELRMAELKEEIESLKNK